MKQKLVLAIATSVIIGVWSTISQGETADSRLPIDEWMQAIKGTNWYKGIEARNHILAEWAHLTEQQRQELADACESIVRDARYDIGVWLGPKHIALSLLPDLKGERALGMLLDNLGYRVDARAIGYNKLHGLSEWPAGESLAKLGKPSITPTFEKLKQSNDPNIQKVCVMILCQILTRHGAREMLGKALEKEVALEAKSNLQAALSYLD